MREAKYIGLKALKKLSFDKYNEKINNAIMNLKKETDILNIRRISYDVGVIFYTKLEEVGNFNWYIWY